MEGKRIVILAGVSSLLTCALYLYREKLASFAVWTRRMPSLGKHDSQEMACPAKENRSGCGKVNLSRDIEKYEETETPLQKKSIAEMASPVNTKFEEGTGDSLVACTCGCCTLPNSHLPSGCTQSCESSTFSTDEFQFSRQCTASVETRLTKLQLKDDLTDDQKILKEHLTNNHIPFDIHPYFDSQNRTCGNSSGIFVKNIALKDRRGNFFLVLVPEEKQVNLKQLKSLLHAYRNFSFASEKELLDLLHVKPGGVSPFGLLFCKGMPISVVFENELLRNNQLLNFHPLDETKTLRISSEDILRFIGDCDCDVQILDLPYV